MDFKNEEIELFKTSGFIDERYYRAKYPDVRLADVDVFEHYFYFGEKELRNPSSKFSPEFYLNSNLDVKNNGMSALRHFILHGEKEGRHPVEKKVMDLTNFRNNVFIVYHVMGNKRGIQIFKEQMNTVKKSGLGDFCTRIYINILGYDGNVQEYLKRFDFFSKIEVRYFSDIKLYEFPSLELVKEIAKENPHSKILYFHTKGASHDLRFSPEQVKNLNQWRYFMEYYNITLWKDCLNYLDDFDVCGVDCHLTKYSLWFWGDFWWSNANYINRCPIFYGEIDDPNRRYYCESYISNGDPSAMCMMSSIKNPKLKEFFKEKEIMKIANPSHPEELANFGGFFYKNEYFLPEEHQKKASSMSYM